MSTAYIALGSNLSDPLRQLQAAIGQISRLPRSHIEALSRVYQSPAVGPGEQPDYLNAALRLDTALEPQVLLGALQDIERAQGRIRGERWGPRTLDLDILLFDDLQIDTVTLTIPHPAMARRNFVLFPLRDVAPGNLVLPGGTDLDTLLAHCPGEQLTDTGLDLNSEATC